MPNPSFKGHAPKLSKADEESGAGAEEIPAELELLKGITGFAEPCMLMALMGGSGAGLWGVWSWNSCQGWWNLHVVLKMAIYGPSWNRVHFELVRHHLWVFGVLRNH